MKYTNKASAYLRRVEPKTLNAIPDSVWLVTAGEIIPKETAPKNCICVVNGATAKEIVNLANSTGMNHFVQEAYGDPNKELSTAAKMITQIAKFNASPVNHILSSAKLETKTWTFSALEEKEVLKTKLKEHTKLMPGARHIEKTVLTITDELLTNCLYHNLPPNTDQHEVENVRLPAGVFANLSIINDEESALILCRDPFGTLTRERLLKPMWASYRGEKIQSVNMGEGGAGIGCRMMFNYCTAFYATVEAGQSTIIGVVLPLATKNNVSLDRAKNLHLYFS